MNDADLLRNLLQRYARAVDTRDLEALAGLFHPDSTIDGARGVLALEEWLGAMATPPAFPSSMHVIGEPLIELDGDRAALDSYAVVFQLGDRSAGQDDMTLGIRYLDQVTRGDDGWRFANRRSITLWRR